MTLPYLPWYAGDWIADTDVLMMSFDAEATYFRLLMHSWRNDGLPADPRECQALTKLAGAPVQKWNAVWRVIERKFPIAADGMRRNPRLEREREKSLALHGQKVSASRVAAEVRRAKAEERKRLKASPSGASLGVSHGASPDRPSGASGGDPGGPIARSSGRSINQNQNQNQLASSAVADEAVARARETTPTAAASESLLAQFDDPLHRDAAAGYIRAAGEPRAVIAHLEGMLSGLSAPGMQPLPPAVVGRALHDMRVAGVVRMTPNALAGFIRGIPRRESDPPADGAPRADGSPPEPVLTDAELEAQMLARIERGEFADV